MNSRLLLFVLIAATLLLFTACIKETPTPTPEITEIPTPAVVTCPPDYLVPPVLTWPAPEALVDTLTPSLTWSYSDVPYTDTTGLSVVPKLWLVRKYRGRGAF